MSSPVSFLSDFGTEDEFVGVVHGVIAKIAPGTHVIDITHGIAPGNVRAGALSLMRAIQYLPEGVALAVVDRHPAAGDRGPDCLGSVRGAGQRAVVAGGGAGGGSDPSP